MTMNREIFTYNNGTRQVHADPLILRDRLLTVSMGEFEPLREKVRKIDAAKDDITVILEGIKAREHLVTIAREVFGMTPFNDADGTGSTASECLAVTEQFLQFLNQKKTRQEQQQTTSTPTASTSPAPIQPTTDTMSASS